MAKSLAKGVGTSSSDMRNALERLQSATCDLALNSGALAIKGAGSALAKTANAVVCLVDGTLVSVAAADMPALTGLGTITDGSFNIVALAADSSGTVTAIGGTEGTTLASVTLPSVSDDLALLGFIIVNASGANFVGGTTALDAGSHVVTYVNNPGGLNFRALTL